MDITMMIIVFASYMLVGLIYYSFTEEDSKRVANPINWIKGMSTWIFAMWRY